MINFLPEQIALPGKIVEHQGWRRPIRVSKLSGFIRAEHVALHAALVSHIGDIAVIEEGDH